MLNAALAVTTLDLAADGYLTGICPLGGVSSDKWRWRLSASSLLMGIFHIQLILGND